MGGVTRESKKPASPKRCKIGPRLLLRTNRKSYRLRAFDWYQNQDLERRIQGLHKVFKVLAIISGTGKATDFKFGRYIHKVHPNKRPLKILEKKQRGRNHGLPKGFKYPLLSHERVKLRTSNLAV